MEAYSSIHIVVIGHGSRVTKTVREFEIFVQNFHDYCKSYAGKPYTSKPYAGSPKQPETVETPQPWGQYSQLTVSFGYIECATPTMEEALEHAASGRERKMIVVVPLLLFRSGHAKTDLPLILNRCREKFAKKRHEWKICDVLGLSRAVMQSAHFTIEKEIFLPQSPARESLPKIDTSKGGDLSAPCLILLGRGSSDPDANGDFFKVLRLINENFPEIQIFPAFSGISKPSLNETIEHVVLNRPSKIFILPYLFFSGVLTQRLTEIVRKMSKRYPWIQFNSLPVLSSHSEFLYQAMMEKISTALQPEGEESLSLLPCQNCQYRIGFRGKEDQINGMKALLYSIRHSFTHTQATPDREGLQHQHSRVKRHILVCCNINCNREGSNDVLHFLQGKIKETSRADELLVSSTSCLGLCGNGPNLIVYPDGIWYQKVTLSVARQILDEHIARDKLVKDHVFTIMD